MKFAFSEEQELLRDAASMLSAELFGGVEAHAAADGCWAAADAAWQQLADLGWLGILMREDIGGGGGSLVDACIIADCLAAALAPVPFVGASIAAMGLLSTEASPVSDAIQREIASGRRVGVALGGDLEWPPVGNAEIAWEAAGGQALLYRQGKMELLDAEVLPRCVDLLHPMGRIGSVARGDVVPGAAHALAMMRVGAAAALVGSLRGVAKLAFQYARDRQQYGKPIGSFQAVQHLCADILVDLDASESVLYGAAWSVENRATDAAFSASVAKSWCGEAAVRSTENAIQVLGGIGVTFESDAHLYLRQAVGYSRILGDYHQLHREVGRHLVERQARDQGSARRDHGAHCR